MSRGSFSRSVARAAASGGGKAYRARRPIAWYAVITLVCVVGIGLIVYSRNEKLHPARAVTIGPTATDHWKSALAFDICGKFQPSLAANSNLSSVGLRTFGDGLIDIDPGATSSPSTWTGAKATLGLFAKNYPGLTLTATSVKLPGKNETLWSNGTKCGTVAGKLQTEVWPSPTGKGRRLTTSPLSLHLTNGQMITVAFVPVGATIPQPSAGVRSSLESFLGQSTTTSGASTTTAPSSSSSSSTTTSTTKSSTTTTAKSTSTT